MAANVVNSEEKCLGGWCGGRDFRTIFRLSCEIVVQLFNDYLTLEDLCRFDSTSRAVRSFLEQECKLFGSDGYPFRQTTLENIFDSPKTSGIRYKSFLEWAAQREVQLRYIVISGMKIRIDDELVIRVIERCCLQAFAISFTGCHDLTAASYLSLSTAGNFSHLRQLSFENCLSLNDDILSQFSRVHIVSLCIRACTNVRSTFFLPPYHHQHHHQQHQQQPATTTAVTSSCSTTNGITGKTDWSYLQEIELTENHASADLTELVASSVGQLESITLQGCPRVRSDTFIALLDHGRCSTLINCNLCGCSWVNDDILVTIALNCKELDSLTFDGLYDADNRTLSGVTNRGLLAIAGNCKELTNFECTSMCSNDINEGIVQILELCTQLTSLHVPVVTDFVTSTIIARGKNLTRLLLFGDIISDDDVNDILASCKNLARMDLTGCSQVTAKAFFDNIDIICGRSGRGSCGNDTMSEEEEEEEVEGTMIIEADFETQVGTDILRTLYTFDIICEDPDTDGVASCGALFADRKVVIADDVFVDEFEEMKFVDKCESDADLRYGIRAWAEWYLKQDHDDNESDIGDDVEEDGEEEVVEG